MANIEQNILSPIEFQKPYAYRLIYLLWQNCLLHFLDLWSLHRFCKRHVPYVRRTSSMRDRSYCIR